MFRRKSKRIQYRRLFHHEIVRSTILITGLILVWAEGTAQISSDNRFHQAEISYQTSKWDDALKEFNLLLADSTVRQSAHLYYRISQCQENLGKIDLALTFAGSAVQEDTLQDEYLSHFARLLEMKYRYSEAWPIRMQLLERQPRYISRFFAVIDNARNRNDHEAVLILSQRWIHQFGRNLYITEVLSETYLKLNQREKALMAFDSLIARYPQREEYLIKRNALKSGGKTPHPFSNTYYQEKKAISEAMRFLDEGNPAKAYELLQEIVKEEPENILAHKLQFLSAYLDNNLEGLNRVLENFYILFPFLEDVQKTAEWIVAFKSKKNHAFEMDKLLFTAEWEFIRIDVHLKLGNIKKAQALWNSLQQNLQISKIIPAFYKNQINDQLKK
jgi:tetratricopeptide (TPR) repeat protein